MLLNCQVRWLARWSLAGLARCQLFDPWPVRNGAAVIAFIVFVRAFCPHCRAVSKAPAWQQGVGGDQSFPPLKINVPGVIPPIFASSLLLMPISIINLSGSQGGGAEWLVTLNALLGRGQPLYLAIYIGLIVFFAFSTRQSSLIQKTRLRICAKYGGYIPAFVPWQDNRRLSDSADPFDGSWCGLSFGCLYPSGDSD